MQKAIPQCYEIGGMDFNINPEVKFFFVFFKPFDNWQSEE